MARFLHQVCEKQGLPIRWETAQSIIEKVEIYTKKLDFDYGLTEDMLRSSMRKYEADDLTQESLVTFLQKRDRKASRPRRSHCWVYSGQTSDRRTIRT
jgi:hypothetical protein